jgi:hypothetical protein
MSGECLSSVSFPGWSPPCLHSIQKTSGCSDQCEERLSLWFPFSFIMKRKVFSLTNAMPILCKLFVVLLFRFTAVLCFQPFPLVLKVIVQCSTPNINSWL